MIWSIMYNVTWSNYNSWLCHRRHQTIVNGHWRWRPRVAVEVYFSLRPGVSFTSETPTLSFKLSCQAFLIWSSNGADNIQIQDSQWQGWCNSLQPTGGRFQLYLAKLKVTLPFIARPVAAGLWDLDWHMRYPSGGRVMKLEFLVLLCNYDTRKRHQINFFLKFYYLSYLWGHINNLLRPL